MKTLFRLIILLTVFSLFTQTSFADKLQTVFTPNASTAIFLNCYNPDEAVVQKYQELKKLMATKWPVAKKAKTEAFFLPYYPFTKQIIFIYVGGVKKMNGALCPLPNTTYIASHFHKKTSRAMINIKTPKKTIREVQSIMQ